MTKTDDTWKYAEHTRAEEVGNHVVRKDDIKKDQAGESHEIQCVGNGKSLRREMDG